MRTWTPIGVNEGEWDIPTPGELPDNKLLLKISSKYKNIIDQHLLIP